MKPKLTWQQLKKRIYAVNEQTPRAEIERLLLITHHRAYMREDPPPDYASWGWVGYHIARRWDGSKR